jgi:NADPH-dependent 2,4-dienoyl-CoA reductase/sulfur reductase-like enzyme
MDFVVIGGGASGMAAASKAKRVDPSINVTVVEAGNYVSYAECGIPYYLEGIVKSPENLLHYPIEEFTKKRGIKILLNDTVKSIDRSSRNIVTAKNGRISYDKLLIATGASPKVPKEFSDMGVNGIRSLEDAKAMNDRIDHAKTIAIIGDGILGLELAASLVARGKDVTVISRHSRILKNIDERVGSDFRADYLSRVHVLLNAGINEIKKDGEAYRIVTENGTANADLVISATGIRANSGLAADAGLKIDGRGLIEVDSRMYTSDPDILAVGDCAQTTNLVTGKKDWHPLAQVSNKMGRVAGSNVAGSEMNFPGSLGTTLVKLFDYEIGFTGISEAEAKENGFSPVTTFVKAMSRAAYYPGKTPVNMTLVYDSSSGRILGSQIISRDGGAWRLNTVATAIQGKMGIEDLFYTDLGYTPPFGPVWDPIIVAASLSMRE